ncbi:MAG: cytidylate kinase family protein [Candidatus Bathyarchaeota archaeon]|nr:cytidylate kinase family protein [Candidatus Bathyarchaeota archaeon]
MAPAIKKQQSIAQQNVVLCISGMAGTGKSTLSKKIAERYNLKYFSGGDALKALAIKQGYDAAKEGWWESSEGLTFLARREKDPQFDKAVDNKLLDYAKEGNVLLDSWTMPWLLKDGFKIWLLASLEKRAERIAKRDKLTVKEAFEVLEKKESLTKSIYRELYGFTLGEDLAPFDLVLDTDNLAAPEVYSVICNVLDNIVFQKNSST